jgi:outer membrane receptor protein involved in Fe transport
VQLGLQPRDDNFFDYLQGFTGKGPITRYLEASFDRDYRVCFDAFGADLQQILILGPATTVFGARFQSGNFETRARLGDFNNLTHPDEVSLFRNPPADQEFTTDFQRLSCYLYETWHIAPWLAVTGGITWDHLEYPDNFREPPVSDGEREFEQASPKAGVILQPWKGATIRAAYSEAISGTSFDESVRLEPTQVAGFLQAYRTIAPESLTGSAAGARYRVSGLSLEQRLPTRTYLGLEWNHLAQNSDRAIGVFDLLDDFGTVLAVLPSSIDENIRYREDSIVATVNQLLGERWSLGARYRYTHSELVRELDGFGNALRVTQDPTAIDDLARKSRSHSASGLHEVSLQALYYHPSGFFARAEANWYRQENDDFVISGTLTDPDENFRYRRTLKTTDRGLPGEDFWQFNAFVGYQFASNRAELSCGVLNLTGADYRLTPLNPYPELVRDRTVVFRVRFEF